MSTPKKLVSKTIHGLLFSSTPNTTEDGTPIYSDVVSTLHYLQGKDLPLTVVVPLFTMQFNYTANMDHNNYIVMEPTDQKKRLTEYHNKLEEWELQDKTDATMINWFSDFIKTNIENIDDIPEEMKKHFFAIPEEKRSKWLPAKPEHPGELERTVVVFYDRGIRYATTKNVSKTLAHYNITDDDTNEKTPSLE